MEALVKGLPKTSAEKEIIGGGWGDVPLEGAGGGNGNRGTVFTSCFQTGEKEGRTALKAGGGKVVRGLVGYGRGKRKRK